MDLARIFKRYRARKGIKQEAISGDSGASRKHISAIETGATDPTVGMLNAVVRSMGGSLAEFFESRIPNVYAVETHADLHEILQQILESDCKSKIEFVTKAIEMSHDAMIEEEKKILKSPREQSQRIV
jgi:transcriptional regulator with XRE-family HTH domain